GEALVEVVTVVGAARLEIGHSVLSMTPGDLTGAGQATDLANIATTPNGHVVLRCPRPVSTWNPQPVTCPAEDAAPSESSGGLLPAILALAGSGVLAMLVHQPMFLLFGAIGAIAAFGTWGGQQITSLRRHRRN